MPDVVVAPAALPERKKSGPRPVAMEMITAVGIDRICEMIEHEDLAYFDIAKRIGVSPASLMGWLEADHDRSARARESRVRSAQACDRLAQKALEDIDANATSAIVVRQREIAHHLRWRAKARNPREYGEKLQVEAEVTTLTPDQVEERIARLAGRAV